MLLIFPFFPSIESKEAEKELIELFLFIKESNEVYKFLIFVFLLSKFDNDELMLLKLFKTV